jgi:tRNA pseudouridine55 synthase
LLVDKPAGPTSHDVVDAVRRALGIRRVGHTGTLDPFASGLLVILVGRATRLAQFLVGLPKSYEGIIQLGVRTDTDDATGVELEVSESWRDLSRAQLLDAMGELTGRTVQRPPVYSARKSAGERAHRRARRGEPVTLEAREIDVTAFDLIAHDGPSVRFRADVGSGTYVRAIARDLGASLGCGAHVAELRRTAVGAFGVDEAVPPSAFDDCAPRLLPVRGAVSHLPVLKLDETEIEAVRHGRPIPREGDVEGPVALVSGADLIAVAEPDQGVLKPRVVLAGD